MAAVKGITRITVAAGAAKPSPSIGQALGPLGVNMMEFCKVASTFLGVLLLGLTDEWSEHPIISLDQPRTSRRISMQKLLCTALRRSCEFGSRLSRIGMRYDDSGPMVSLVLLPLSHTCVTDNTTLRRTRTFI